MSYSYYEVFTNTQRAFSGLGFPYGSDEEAAYIITWLELCGLNGIELLTSKINELDNCYKANIDPKKINIEFDCNNKSILMIGPGLIDYLVSKLNYNDKILLFIKNCKDPIFFIPLLYKYSKKNINTQIVSNKNIIANITGKIISLKQEILSINYKKNFDLLLTNKLVSEQSLDININVSSINETLSNGINPNKKSWDQISKIAFRTFVPESEESRAKGAGGGDAND